MLKKLILLKQRGTISESIKALEEKEAGFKVRESELETAISEATNDEEIKIIEDEIDNLENDKNEVKEEKEGLQKRLDEIDAEIKEIEEKKPDDKEEGKDSERKSNQNIEVRGGVNMMTNTREARIAELTKREDVKEFLGRLRAFKNEERKVTGAELGIPTVMLGVIRDEINRYSKLINKVNKKPTRGQGRMLIAGNIPEGVWTEACGTLNELELKFFMTEVDGFKVGGFIPVCNATLEDTDIELANEIIDALGQAIGLAVDKAILYGTGKKMPTGIVTRLNQTQKPDGWSEKDVPWVDLHTTNVITWDGSAKSGVEFFSELILKLGVAKSKGLVSGKFFAMSENTATEILAKALSFNAAGAMVSSAQGTMPVIGGELITLDFIPDGDIIGGYEKGYLLSERADVKIESSTEVRFIQDQTVFKGTARYDGKPIVGEAFVHMNIKNTAPTKTVDFAPDSPSI